MGLVTQQETVESVCGLMGTLHHIASEEKSISQPYSCNMAIGCWSCIVASFREDRAMKQLTKERFTVAIAS